MQAGSGETILRIEPYVFGIFLPLTAEGFETVYLPKFHKVLRERKIHSC